MMVAYTLLFISHWLQPMINISSCFGVCHFTTRRLLFFLILTVGDFNVLCLLNLKLYAVCKKCEYASQVSGNYWWFLTPDGQHTSHLHLVSSGAM